MIVVWNDVHYKTISIFVIYVSFKIYTRYFYSFKTDSLLTLQANYWDIKLLLRFKTFTGILNFYWDRKIFTGMKMLAPEYPW